MDDSDSEGEDQFKLFIFCVYWFLEHSENTLITLLKFTDTVTVHLYVHSCGPV